MRMTVAVLALMMGLSGAQAAGCLQGALVGGGRRALRGPAMDCWVPPLDAFMAAMKQMKKPSAGLNRKGSLTNITGKGAGACVAVRREPACG